ncbi:unnamed protein product [Microthlaspi erraticum]|uniref:RRM domain-containing protein n=1 Tax=Microthlaspi erraticum TaxID=1685480 RepID=A0A6D2K0L2_9BRAS|nr:unnamed protein product [Microthlaspi erraticum]
MASSAANSLGKRKSEDDLEAKPILKKNKENSEDKETNSDQAKKPLACKKTLFIGILPPKAEISDIIDFFKDVGQVVRVRRLVNNQANYRCSGFVEFATHRESKMALQYKNRQYLLDDKIFLMGAHGLLPPKYEDYPQQESLPIKEQEQEQEDEDEDEDETPPDSVNINFFDDVAYATSVRLIVNHEGKHVGCGFVEFPSVHQAKNALENKNGEFLHDHKIFLMKGPDKAPDSVEATAVIEKTLYVANLSDETGISDIISFFKDVGEVVHVRLMVNKKGMHVGDGFVEFASSDEANKALENKNGECLHDCEIFLDVVKANRYPPYPRRPMYEDYIRRETLLVEEDAAVKGLEETPDNVEEVAAREKTVFVANVSMEKYALDIKHINEIFKGVGKIVRVRLIVDHKSELVGCCFVEFASANEAKKAVQWRDGSMVYVNMAEIAPYPFRRKYNLHKLAEKLWYEDNLRREDLGLINKAKLRVRSFYSPGISRGQKKTFSYDD